jgi:hypothetical protein
MLGAMVNVGQSLIGKIVSWLAAQIAGKPLHSQYYPRLSPEAIDRARKDSVADAPGPQAVTAIIPIRPVEATGAATESSVAVTQRLNQIPGPEAAPAVKRGAELYDAYRKRKEGKEKEKSPWLAIRQEVVHLIPGYADLLPDDQDEEWEKTRHAIEQYWSRNFKK